MRILFDQRTPAPLRRQLTDHDVATAFEQGWSDLSNGSLLDIAEQAGFELLVTTDSNLRYQQNLTERRIAIIVPAICFLASHPESDHPYSGRGQSVIRWVVRRD